MKTLYDLFKAMLWGALLLITAINVFFIAGTINQTYKTSATESVLKYPTKIGFNDVSKNLASEWQLDNESFDEATVGKMKWEIAIEQLYEMQNQVFTVATNNKELAKKIINEYLNSPKNTELQKLLTKNFEIRKFISLTVLTFCLTISLCFIFVLLSFKKHTFKNIFILFLLIFPFAILERMVLDLSANSLLFSDNDKVHFFAFVIYVFLVYPPTFVLRNRIKN